MLLGGGGYYVALMPVSAISVDVNPSVELTLNRLDRVIAVEGFNPEGEAPAESLSVTFLPYTSALEAILESEGMSGYLSAGGEVSITVACSDPDRQEALLAGAKSCAQACEGTVTCHGGGAGAMEQAHHAGLSVGKYQAVQELLALDPDITREEAEGMSMAQLRAAIAALSGGEQTGQWGGQGHGHGHGGR